MRNHKNQTRLHSIKYTFKYKLTHNQSWFCNNNQTQQICIIQERAKTQMTDEDFCSFRLVWIPTPPGQYGIRTVSHSFVVRYLSRDNFFLFIQRPLIIIICPEQRVMLII